MKPICRYRILGNIDSNYNHSHFFSIVYFSSCTSSRVGSRKKDTQCNYQKSQYIKYFDGKIPHSNNNNQKPFGKKLWP